MINAPRATTNKVAVRIVMMLAVLVAATACRGEETTADGGSTVSSPAGAASPSPPPMEERMPRLAACLREHGFHAEVIDVAADGVGGLDLGSIPDGQRETMRKTMMECQRDLGWDTDPPPLTPEELTARYELGVEVHKCLVENGLPSSPPPTLDVFIETETGRWWPGGLKLSKDNRDLIPEAFEACPDLDQFFISDLDPG